MIDRLAILADDLTGAADTGAAFAAAGLRSVVLLSPDAPIPAAPDVLVMSSESRDLLPADAAEAIRRCAVRIGDWCGADTSIPVYVKVDSTMRGHPGVQLAVVRAMLGEVRALVAPAFPAQGRTTVHGRQCVHGVPLDETTFGSEIGSSDLATLFAPTAPESVVRLPRHDLQRGVEHVAARLADTHDDVVWIADAECEADLDILADAVRTSPVRVLCGSAGLARALVRAHLRETAMAGVDVLPSRAQHESRRAPVLVVAGSRHAATTAQVEALQRDGAVIVLPERAWLEDGDASSAASTATRVGDALSTGQVVVIATTGLPELRADGRAVAASLATIVSHVFDRAPVGGLVLTGGDTASAVCDALGVRSLWLTGEVEPGIAAATLIGGRCDNLGVVTKAGGFGDSDALRRAVTFLAATTV